MHGELMQPRPTAEPILLEAIALVHRLEVDRCRAAEEDVLEPHAVAEALDVQAHLEPAVAMRNAVVIHTVLVDHLRESLHSIPRLSFRETLKRHNAGYTRKSTRPQTSSWRPTPTQETSEEK